MATLVEQEPGNSGIGYHLCPSAFHGRMVGTHTACGSKNRSRYQERPKTLFIGLAQCVDVLILIEDQIDDGIDIGNGDLTVAVHVTDVIAVNVDRHAGVA